MSWIQVLDTPTGLQVNFNDYRDNAPFGGAVGDAAGCGAEDDFVQTTLVTGLDRTQGAHDRDGDEVPRRSAERRGQGLVDGKHEITGTSWEDYFRYCEGNPTRTVDSVLFRTAGVAAPATLGKGFLIDRLALFSGTR